MTLYYSLVFFVLVIEMLVFLVLVAPLPAKVHHGAVQLFRKPWMARVILALKFTFVFILVLFADSVNRVMKTTADLERSDRLAVVDRGDYLARKFYAQRNMYLCGFTLFLSLIVNRTFVMVKELSEYRMMALNKEGKDGGDSLLVADLKAKLQSKQTDYKALKAQSEGLQREYERVCDELKATKATAGGGGEDPKLR